MELFQADVEREQAMIESRVQYMAGFPKVHDYIADCNDKLQALVRPFVSLHHPPTRLTTQSHLADLVVFISRGTLEQAHRPIALTVVASTSATHLFHRYGALGLSRCATHHSYHDGVIISCPL